MEGSQVTLDSSCPTLHDGIRFVEGELSIEDLEREIQDR